MLIIYIMSRVKKNMWRRFCDLFQPDDATNDVLEPFVEEIVGVAPDFIDSESELEEPISVLEPVVSVISVLEPVIEVIEVILEEPVVSVLEPIVSEVIEVILE